MRFKHKKKDEIINVSNVRLLYSSDGVLHIDPSGQYVGFKATSSGTKEQEAMSHLEKQFKKNNGDWDNRQTVEVALTVLQAVTSSDFKADEVEIGYCSVENPRFRKLTESEIENVLNDLADKQ